jgi:hypothetical protein
MPLWKSLYPNFVIDYNLMRNNSVLTKLDIFCGQSVCIMLGLLAKAETKPST